MGSNHIHDMFRNTFGDKPKVVVNEGTEEITLSGETLPYPKDIRVGLTKCDKNK